MNNVHSSWFPLFEQYDINIDEMYKNAVVYPPKEDVFKVFQMSVFEIKICLLGQDPYHGRGQGMGFAFSVVKNVNIPPSLRNMFKEICLNFPERKYNFKNGDLSRWFYEEKIFLLNCALTVEEAKPNSHASYWESFTNDVIKFISENNKSCVFMLLGKFAIGKKEFIENLDNVVEAPHPSPLARGFIGSDVFKKIEEKVGTVNWNN